MKPDDDLPQQLHDLADHFHIQAKSMQENLDVLAVQVKQITKVISAAAERLKLPPKEEKKHVAEPARVEHHKPK